MDKTYKGLIFTDGKGRKCIHGTDPTHPYVVVFVNEKGVVGVKSPQEYGGEETDRIRCITWDVLTGASDSDDYSELIEEFGWEEKSVNTHTSVRAGDGVCDCCGQKVLEHDTEYRVQEAIDFLCG